MKFAHAHVEVSSIANDVSLEPGLPVFGDAITGLIAMLLAILFLYGAYKFFDSYIKGKPKPLEVQIGLGKVAVGLIIASVMSAALDIWWHRAVGRETIFVPPHLLMYFFVSAAIFTCIYGWYTYRHKVWKRCTFFLIVLLASAPFDNYWHILFGVENLSRPVSLSWAPPHMMLDIGAMGALLSLIPLFLHEHKLTTRTFFLDLIFATLLAMLSFLVMPFHPTEGWGAVLGFCGAGVLTLVYVGVLAFAQKLMRGEYNSIRITLYFIVLVLVGFGKETAPGIVLLPHDRPPVWIFIFSFVALAVFMDILKHIPLWLRGALAGVVWAAITFGLERYFFAPEFYFGNNAVMVAVVSSLFGGTIGGYIGLRTGEKIRNNIKT